MIRCKRHMTEDGRQLECDCSAMWTEQAAFHYSWAVALAARAAAELDIDDLVDEIESLPLTPVTGEGFWTPNDAETALMECGTRLEMCKMSLLEIANTSLANRVNDVRGRIMSWFDRDL